MAFAPSYVPSVFAWGMSGAGGGRAQRRRMSSPQTIPSPDDRSLEDARLVRRMAGGEHQAMAELYDRFSRPLYSTALHILQDAAEAQDIVHDVFITLWQKAAVFAAERGTAFSWAVTLTRNRAIDRLRSRRRRAELLAGAAPADLGYFETVTGADARTAARARARLLQRPHPAGNRRPAQRAPRHRQGPHPPRPGQTPRHARAPSMIDDRQEELASLYALDLLEGAEKAEFQGMLARDPALRRQVDELRAAASELARLAPQAEPPPELRAPARPSSCLSRA
jgi:RNA polymerase sigma factor (sigma-70 family)